MNHQEYADKWRHRYVEWCQRVEEGPYAALDKVEFALISAHTKQERAIEGFLGTRNHYAQEEVFLGLYRAGVMAPRVKAGRIVRLRRAVDSGRVVIPGSKEFGAFRRDTKVEGLGFCKLSFGLALTAPLESGVVCLDTHLCRVFGRKTAWVWNKLDNYMQVEEEVKAEAVEVGLPPFAYQWAVWDFQRSQEHFAPDDHSFLWQGGRRQYQIRMEV